MEKEIIKMINNSAEETKKYILKTIQTHNRINYLVEYVCESCGQNVYQSARAFLKKNKYLCRSCSTSQTLKEQIKGHEQERVDKWKEAIKTKYGVDNVAKLESVQDKRKKAFAEKRQK